MQKKNVLFLWKLSTQKSPLTNFEELYVSILKRKEWKAHSFDSRRLFFHVNLFKKNEIHFLNSSLLLFICFSFSYYIKHNWIFKIQSCIFYVFNPYLRHFHRQLCTFFSILCNFFLLPNFFNFFMAIFKKQILQLPKS